MAPTTVEFPTYAYGENGHVTAYHGKHVIASGQEFSKVSATAEEYFEELRRTQEKKAADDARHQATHILTPNGMKGTILGRTASWNGEEITVRFENGQIRHFDTFAGDGLRYATEEADVPKTPIEYFQRRLDEVTGGSKGDLTDRLNVLDEVRSGAARLASQAPVGDAQKLHQIVLTADAEKREVKEALAYLEEIDEAIAPPKMAYVAAEQAALGRAKDDTWLDVVASQMIAESEDQDFDKLLSEGPTTFVSSLESAALGNSGVTTELARQFIVSKTAGFKGDAVEKYRDQFVASAELARKRELEYRKDVVAKETSVKEASVADVPDDALFI